MNESSGIIQETLSVLFWLSWFVLLYLAWPRLLGLGRRLLRKRATGQPVKLLIPSVRSRREDTVATGLRWAVIVFLGRVHKISEA